MAGFSTVDDGGVDSPIVEVDNVEETETPESGGRVDATGAGFGEFRGDTLGTGLDNLDPPEVLATTLGPPTALAGLDALEAGVESGERRFGNAASAAIVVLGLASVVSLSELSEAEVEDSASTGFGIGLIDS